MLSQPEEFDKSRRESYEDLPNKMFYHLVERDPTKRKVKPAQALFELEDLEESSDDSDFRIEDHCEESDDDDSIDSANNNAQEEEETDDSEDSDIQLLEREREDAQQYITALSDKAPGSAKTFNPKDALKIMICTVCLGDKSDSTNEIIECDYCGVTVHEGCYGVQDSDSVCSTDSPCPTTPWFCDACKAGEDDAVCELCPNTGGIFKETDVGKWVHLVCALYVPGVAFAEVDKLHNVTLFEMSYSKWGAKSCGLCLDQRLARTGVCVGCDAGLCKTYFHVTCGQREGLLAEAHSEEADQADPFYAHCKLHTDRALLKKRKRNWLALQMRMEEIRKNKREDSEVQRIQRRLAKYRTKYLSGRANRLQPWVPTQKMARLLTTSASACRALWKKAELSGADTESWAMRQAQVEALSDIHKRWHIQPAFSVEFIGYYLDRNVRVATMKKQLAELIDENSKLLDEQLAVEEERDVALKENSETNESNNDLKKSIKQFHDVIKAISANKKLPAVDLMGLPVLEPSFFSDLRRMSPYGKKSGNESSESKHSNNSVDEPVDLNTACGLCNGRQDQHLLAKCDTCNKHYHLGCLDPPLLRLPKKTKQMGWQCSECDKDTDHAKNDVDSERPRRIRKPGNGDSSFSDFISIPDSLSAEDIPFEKSGEAENTEEGVRGKKRRREKHHRYSPDLGFVSKPHKHKHKRSKQQEEQRQSLKICFKSVPDPTGGSSYVATPSGGLASANSKSVLNTSAPAVLTTATSPDTTASMPLTVSLHTQPNTSARASIKKKEEPPSVCATCNLIGDTSNLVKCDECLLGFHFHCLDPPVKKSPKVRGYSWHCANCDPTESE